MSPAQRVGRREAWSAAAHDVKTPVAVVSGFAELLLTREDAATRVEAAEQILAASRRIAADLDDLVTLLAIADDAVDVTAESLPLLEVVRAAIDASADGHAKPIVVEEDAPVVHADREHLSRILGTLLACARRAQSHPDAPHLKVSSRANRGLVSVEVDGPADALAGRLDVLLARRLAELQGGSLETENGLVRVASLTLAVPVADCPPAKVETRRILVVEDDAAVRSLLRATLPDGEYKVIEAADGRSGLALALENRVDLVLLDWRLPGRSGPYVLRELKEQRPQVPVLVLTASTDDEARRLAGELGANAFLTKPFSPLELLDAVERLAG